MHGRTAQVQIAVAQAQIVVDVDLVAQLKRRGLGLTQDAQLADVELYVAGCDLIGLGGALTQLAAADNNVLAFQALGLGETSFGVSSSNTSCKMPVVSRRSAKMMPPLSRARAMDRRRSFPDRPWQA